MYILPDKIYGICRGMQAQKRPRTGSAGASERSCYTYSALEKRGIINGALVGDLALQVVH